MKYLAYVRKSTEESDRQAMSLEAQVDAIIKQFPNLEIEFLKDEDGNIGESMSAAKTGRPLFNKMLKMFDSGKYAGLLAWHPDRLARNARDSAEIVCRIKDGIIPDLRFCNFYFEPTPEGIMMLQMIMSQAEYFSAKLKKDIRRGNAQKRKHGGVNYPPSIGYKNDTVNHTIVADLERFGLVRKAFELMLTGNYSVREVLNIMNEEWGFRMLKYKVRGGGPVSYPTLCRVFRNKFYAGIVTDPYTGEEFKGQHPAMITLDEYKRLQDILDGKAYKVTPTVKDFPLRGFIRCGECGCSITAENKTKRQKNGNVHRYVYYHCTRKSKDHVCRQRAIQDKDLEAQLEELLNSYEISPKLYEWGMKAIKEIADKEVKDRNEVQKSQNKAVEDVQRQLDRLLNLATMGFIPPEEYSKKSESLRATLKKLQKEQGETAERVRSWYEIVGTTLQQLDSATEKFNKGNVTDKRRVLSALGSDPILTDGKLTLKEHFWLKPIKDNKESITEELKKVRTAPEQIKNASEEAIYKKWWSVGGSNS